jgi:hypothetical protein
MEFKTGNQTSTTRTSKSSSSSSSSEPPPAKMKARIPSSGGSDETTTMLKAPQRSSSRLLLTDLDEDILRAILVRTCASDHEALRQTCQRIRHTMDSFAFRKERCELGFAEVRCEILPPFEQYKLDEGYNEEDEEEDRPVLCEADSSFQDNYDELGFKGDYGNHYIEHFRVFVDGKQIQMKDRLRYR